MAPGLTDRAPWSTLLQDPLSLTVENFKQVNQSVGSLLLTFPQDKPFMNSEMLLQRRYLEQLKSEKLQQEVDQLKKDKERLERENEELRSRLLDLDCDRLVAQDYT